MSTISEAYRCNECYTWHDNEDDARECCPPSFTEGYKCDGCGEYHKEKKEAEECCPGYFTCPDCEKEFPSLELAEECCGCEIDSAFIPPEVLERYGQQRLEL